MPMTCSVPRCSANAQKNKGLSFFSFPKNSFLRKKWWLAVKTAKAPTYFSKVCSRHFTEDDFISRKNEATNVVTYRKLKEDAIPHCHLPVLKLEAIDVYRKPLRKLDKPVARQKGTCFNGDSKQDHIEIKSLNDVEMNTPLATLTTPPTFNINAASGSGTSLLRNTTRYYSILKKATQTPLNDNSISSETEESSVNDRLQEDQFEAAGKNIIAKLKVLPKTQRILAERLIYDVLLEAEMGTLKTTSKLQI